MTRHFLLIATLVASVFCSGLVMAQDDAIVPVPIGLAPFGAKVYGYNAVPSGTHTVASFSTEQWDVGGFFNPIDPYVIEVPALKDLSGRYEIHVAVRWYNPEGPVGSNSYFYTYLKVNGMNVGNDARATKSMVTGASGTTQYYSVEVNLSLGDTVEVGLWQGFGVPIDADVTLTVTYRPR